MNINAIKCYAKLPNSLLWKRLRENLLDVVEFAPFVPRKTLLMEFSIKPVPFFEREVAVICQNENGPCPLIAIANILLLQNKLNLSPDRGMISLEKLTQIVAEVILEKLGKRSTPEHSKLMESVFNILPKLAHGLDLNVKFSGVDAFEFTEEISVFDALAIRLLHGWVYDPSNAELCSVVGDMSYNHVLFKLVDYKTVISPVRRKADPAAEQNVSVSEAVEPIEQNEETKKLVYEGAVLERFLADTAPQFTYHGMLALYDTVRDGEFAVFFRNNHFSTLFFHQGQLFTLVTDLGYRHESRVVWEVLNSTDGASEFYNAEFVPLSALPMSASSDYLQLLAGAGEGEGLSSRASQANSAGGTPHSHSAQLPATPHSLEGGTIAAPPPPGYKFGSKASTPAGSSTPSAAPSTATGATNTVGIAEVSNRVEAGAEAQQRSKTDDSYVLIDGSGAGQGDDPTESPLHSTASDMSVIPATVVDAPPDAATQNTTLGEPACTRDAQPERPPAEGLRGAAPAPAQKQMAVTPTPSATQDSSYDADLMLALSLQEQEDALARAAAAAQNRGQGTGAGMGGGYARTQEERDREHAMRLYEEELAAARAHNQRNGWGSQQGLSQGQSRGQQRRPSEGTSKGNNSSCAIC